MEMRLAHPLATLSIQLPRKAQDMDLIAPLVREWQPVLLVVGVPRYGDAQEHPLAKPCQTFARRLHSRFGIPAVTVDEAYSSCEADALLKQTGAGLTARKERVDQVAAQQILETFFELTSRVAKS